MEYAIIARLVVEAVSATAVIVAVILFLRDRGSARAADLGDRAAERASLIHLVDNAVAHNTAAIEANTREQRAGAGAVGRLARSVDTLAGRLSNCPCSSDAAARPGDSAP